MNCSALIKLLLEEGVPHKLVVAIASIFSFNTSCLKVGNRLTCAMNVNVGLREGGVLSPILFSIIFLVAIRKLSFTIFWDGTRASNMSGDFLLPIAHADDLALASPTTEVLNRSIAVLEEEFSKFGLKMSVEKTKAFSFWPSRASVFGRGPIFVYGTRIEWIQEFRYLGVVFHELGKLKKHQEIVVGRARTALGLTVRLMHRLEIHDQKRVKQFFFSFVYSQLQLYGILFLDEGISCDVDCLRREFLRSLFGLHRSFPHWWLDLLLPVDNGVALAANARIGFLNGIFSLNQWSPTLDALCLSFSELNDRNLGWVWEHRKLAELALVDVPQDLLDEGWGWVDEIRDKQLYDRVQALSLHSTTSRLMTILSDNMGLRNEFLKEAFGLERSSSKGVFLLLSGCARWVLFRVRVDVCPKCSSDNFRSLHLLECSSFWFIGQDVYSFFDQLVKEGRWKELCEKFVEWFEFWLNDVNNARALR